MSAAILPDDDRAEAPPLEHTARANLFRRAVTYRLFEDRLEVVTEGEIQTLALQDILVVHALRIVGASWEIVRRCRISASSNARWQLQSAHFRSWSGFEDRSASYDRLVRALVHRVSGAGPGVTFLVGSPRSTWIGWVVALVFCAGMALLAIPLLFSDMWSALVMFTSSLSALPVSWMMVRSGLAQPVSAEVFLQEACH